MGTGWLDAMFDGGGAPVDAPYVVVSADGDLTAERALAVALPLSLSDGGANASVTLSTSAPVAKTVFVDGTNGTAGGVRGDALKPFDTIARGLAAMQTGDTLLVRAGTYSVADVIDLPDLAEIRIVHEPGVIVTSTANRTYRRSSATALTRLVIEGGSIVNTHATGYAILISGSSVATPGYATGTGEIIIRDCDVQQSNGFVALGITCVGNFYVEDVRVKGGSTSLAQVGLATLRNLDCARTYALTAGFNTGATLPDGFAGPGTLHCYSCKTISVSLTGSLDATFDASCESVDFTTARSAGDLSTGMMLVVDDLTVSDTGTSTRDNLNAIVGDDAIIDAETDLSGTIRGDLYLTEANVTVRGNIVGTVHEDGVGIATLYETSALDARVTAIEGGGAPGPEAFSDSSGALALSTGAYEELCSITPGAGTWQVTAVALLTLSVSSTAAAQVTVNGVQVAFDTASTSATDLGFLLPYTFAYTGLATVAAGQSIDLDARETGGTAAVKSASMTLVKVTGP